MTETVLGLRACIDVDNLDEGIRFYTQALGLKVGRRYKEGWVELLGAPSPIDLVAKPAGSPASPALPQARDYRRHWTPVHLDFVVTDLEASVQKAQDAGAKREGDIKTYSWGRIAVFADPFGHGFCLLQFTGRGYDEMLGG